MSAIDGDPVDFPLLLCIPVLSAAPAPKNNPGSAPGYHMLYDKLKFDWFMFWKRCILIAMQVQSL